MYKDTQRLIKEWIKHDKIVLAVDYDDTIFPWKHNHEKYCDKVIELIKWVEQIGAYIMIHTSSDEDRYEEILDYCKSKGIKVSSINKNAIQDLPYGNEGKPYYNWQLDDRSGLSYAMGVLEEAAEVVITYKNGKRHLDEVG